MEARLPATSTHGRAKLLVHTPQTHASPCEVFRWQLPLNRIARNIVHRAPVPHNQPVAQTSSVMYNPIGAITNEVVPCEKRVSSCNGSGTAT